jgi:hypothetical protein
MLNPKAHQTAPVRVVGTVGLDGLGPAPAPGGSVAESRPLPVGGGPATWLTLEFIAPTHPVRNGLPTSPPRSAAEASVGSCTSACGKRGGERTKPAEQVKALGWPVIELELHHLAVLTSPELVLDPLLELMQEL